MRHRPTAEAVSALWLATLQRAVARASHDVKDALNGVSVNVEVIRSRAARPAVPASAVAQFSEAAGHQLERLTTLLEATLAMSRAERVPTDVGVVLRNAAALCGASSSAADAAVRVHADESVGPLTTQIQGDVVRLAITAPLLEVGAGSDRSTKRADVTCTLSGDFETIFVTIASTDRRPSMPDEVAALVRAAGVRWTDGDHELSLAFSRQ